MLRLASLVLNMGYLQLKASLIINTIPPGSTICATLFFFHWGSSHFSYSFAGFWFFSPVGTIKIGFLGICLAYDTGLCMRVSRYVGASEPSRRGVRTGPNCLLLGPS